MKCEKKNFFSRHLAWKSGKARCPRMNSLAKYLALQYIRRYIAEFNEIECCSSQYSGKNRVTLDHEANRGGSAVPYDKAVCRGAVGESCTSGRRRKTPWGKTGERYKHREEKSGSVALRPVEIPPLYRIWRIPTAYSCSKHEFPGQWVGYSSAVPGCHNSVGQMSPGRTQLLLL